MAIQQFNLLRTEASRKAVKDGPCPRLPSVVGPRQVCRSRLTAAGSRGSNQTTMQVDSLPLSVLESADCQLLFDWAIDAPAGEIGVLQVRASTPGSKSFGSWLRL